MFTDMDDAKAPVKFYINEKISTGIDPRSKKNFEFFV
jgi:hypothetical protein